LNLHRDVLEAASLLNGRVVRTPVVRSDALSDMTGAEVHLKLETLQHTGSFKYRGALRRLLALTADERRRGVVTASTGNHGMAVLRAAEELGVAAEIWVPTSADGAKVAELERRGGRVVRRGAECAESEAIARSEAGRTGRVYVSAYNDPVVVAGQGTMAVEILDELPELTAVVASVGGGGLIAGIAGYLRGERPAARAFGALPENSPAMAESVRAGRIVNARVLPTLSDATAGGIEAGAVTFTLCRDLVAGWAVIDEEGIAEGMRLLFREGHVVEGAAGLAAAGVLALARDGVLRRGDVICAVLCGRNVGPGTLCEVLGVRRAPERA
jgi:threonine dehydratase